MGTRRTVRVSTDTLLYASMSCADWITNQSPVISRNAYPKAQLAGGMKTALLQSTQRGSPDFSRANTSRRCSRSFAGSVCRAWLAASSSCTCCRQSAQGSSAASAQAGCGRIVATAAAKRNRAGMVSTVETMQHLARCRDLGYKRISKHPS